MDESAARLYRGTRERISELAATLTGEQLTTTVPGCPLWTVRDLLAHLVGGAADLVSGNLDDAPSPAWTAAQIDARAGRAVADLVAEWQETGAQLEDRLSTGAVSGFLPSHPYVDSGTHEADLHGALGSGRGDPEVWLRVATMVSTNIGRELGDAATLVVRTPDGEITMGTGGTRTSVDVDTYEFYRALMGRRSVAQVAAWDWHGPVGRYTRTISVLDQTSMDLAD